MSFLESTALTKNVIHPRLSIEGGQRYVPGAFCPDEIPQLGSSSNSQFEAYGKRRDLATWPQRAREQLIPVGSAADGGGEGLGVADAGLPDAVGGEEAQPAPERSLEEAPVADPRH